MFNPSQQCQTANALIKEEKYKFEQINGKLDLSAKYSRFYN